MNFDSPRFFRSKTAGVAMLGVLLVFGVRAAETAPPFQQAVTNGPSATANLFQAVRTGDVVMLRAAIAEKADVNACEAGGLPSLLLLLHSAATPLDEARRQCVVILLESGAAVDSTDDLGRTPLIHAARIGDLETIKILVEAGAYVKTRDGLHKTALFYGIESNRPDIVRYLATHGDLVSLTIQERKLLGKH